MRISVLAAALSSAAVSPALADPAAAAIRTPTNIAPQELGGALRKLAADRRLQILYTTEVVSNRQTSGAVGNFTVDEALTHLLSGTGLVFRYADEKTIAIMRLDESAGVVCTAIPDGLAARETLTRLLECTHTETSPPADSADVSRTTTATGNAAQGDAVANGSERATVRKRRISKWLAGVFTVCGPLILTDAAFCEAAEETSVGPASTALEEIVVTAERRASDIQSTAASISVRGGAELQQQGRYSLQSILEDVPGISAGATNLVTTSGAIGSDTAGSGLTIRGIQSNVGTGGSITSTAAATAVYVDGVYEGVGSTFDIDRVEVLRGPQGTLYGRSATAGVVAIHTRNPSLNEFGVNAQVEHGNYDLQHYSAGVDIPFINDVLGLRLAGNHYDRDGFINGDDGEIENQDVRAKLLFNPSEDFSLLLGIAGQNNTVYSGGRSVGTSTDRDEIIFVDTGTAVSTTRFRQYWAELKWNLGIGTLTYLPAYRTYWQDASVPSGTDPAFQISQTALTPTDYFWTHELRLASNPDSKLIWQIGGLYYDNKLENENTVRNETFNVLAFSAQTSKKTTASGVFAQVTWPVTDALRLTGGLRYDSTKVQVEQIYTSNLALALPPGGPPEILTTATLGGDEGLRKFNNTTYKARLDYDLTPDNLVYASISTGFSPGDISIATCPPTNVPCVLPLEAETLTAYEVGSKNRFLDDRLQLNTAVFYYDYGAYQIQSINVGGFGNPQFLSFAMPVKSYGLELELLYQLSANDRISFDGSYTNAYYVDKPTVVANGVPYSFATYAHEDKLTGSDAQGSSAVPPVALSLAWDHLFNLPGDSTLNLRASGRYTSSRKGHLTAADAAAGLEQAVNIDAQTIGDANLTWTSPERHFTVTAYCRNVADNDYINSVRLVTGGGFTQRLYDPRTYGVTFGVNF